MNMFERSSIIRSPHAFATRHGGISTHEHTRSLNLAFGRGDDDETVLKNLEIFASKIGIDPKSVISLPQIHSDIIFTVKRENRGEGYYARDKIASGDGYITGEKGVTLGIKTADCTPILFEAEMNGEIVAVGAVHAGWRGTVAQIATKCIERLKNEFGADVSHIRAAIGPCIHPCCYEVSEDLYLAVKDALGQDVANRFVLAREGKLGKYSCDLAGINRYLLLSAGLSAENIDVINECTSCYHDKYYSHRYTNGNRGTMLNIISMGN